MQSFWRRWQRRFRGLARMSWSDRALVVESFGMLAAARVLVKTAPGKRLVSRMGGSHVDAADAADAGRRGACSGNAARVGAMVERAARFTWWRSMCLEKALAGKWMLRRRGIGSTMYVGMARQGDEFVAHAWLVGEGQTLTGAGKTVYATLAAFREPRESGARRDLKGV
jgi:hypothetical protein